MIPYLVLPNYCKWIGACCFVAGFVLDGVAAPDLDNLASGIGLLVQVLILFGLLLIAGAKQGIEDELVKHYRLVALQWSVAIFILVRLGFKTFAWLQQMPSTDVDFGVNFLLEVYLLLFYYLLYVQDKVSAMFNNQ
jgi:hypothetical protein